MTIDTTFVARCIGTLETNYQNLQAITDTSSVDADVCRHVILNQCETILQQAGKLLRKCLLPYFHSKRAVDALPYNDVFRYAGHHGILELAEVERWLQYRTFYATATDDDTQLYDILSASIPQCIIDARALVAVIEQHNAIAC